MELNSLSVVLEQRTQYPWEGEIQLTVTPSRTETFAIMLRYPGWCREFELFINGERVTDVTVLKGYLKLNRQWQQGDVIQLNLSMSAELVFCDERVIQNRGHACIVRGPLVYAAEEFDNPDFSSLNVGADSRFISERMDQPAVLILRDVVHGGVFVPYFSWDNRYPGKMRVWIPYLEREDNYLYSR